MSINKIHVNNSTTLSLNDRFTVMQSVGPKLPSPSPSRRVAPRRRTQSASSSADHASSNISMANRKLLEQLDKKHKMRAALKLKRKSLKAVVPSRPRIRNRIGLRKGAASTTAAAIRLAPNGRLSRSNSLTNIATMKADLVQSHALRRSNSTSSLAGRLGSRRASTGNAPSGSRRRIRRNNIVRTSSRPNLTRSNSTASLRRSNSRLNLTRSNSRSNLNRASGAGQSAPQRRRIARNPIRSASATRRGNSQRRSNSVSNRLGVRKVPTMARDRRRATANSVRGGRPVRSQSRQRGRGTILRRRNSTASLSQQPRNGAAGGRQGRLGRTRGRGNSNNTPRGRSRSRSRARNAGPSSGNRGNRSTSRSRGRGRGRGQGRGQGIRRDIRKEDLDNEIDQYMANTAADNMDI